MKNIKRLSLAVALAMVSVGGTLHAQTTVKPVVLQGFWWDYWNSNYPGSWANYLTELAPRLHDMGIDAVWIPPITKGNSGEGSVGYDVFDQYDLGDKFQKGSTNTRVGTKDEVLRMIAVMHANGIQVIQDVVLNHTMGAGDQNGSLGSDVNAPDDPYKTFRYASYGTPAVYSPSDNYLSRAGRWSKNHQNFHPNSDHNCNSGDICQQMFGPDICYYSGAYGQATSAAYNPAQASNYMRNEARDWIMWLKKQTGVDGFRWDATKHFPVWVQQDLSYNLKYVLPSWAQGGEAMFNVGEYVDFNGGNLDNYVSSVGSANGGSEYMMGAFDFSLRSGIYNMVSGSGYYDMSALAGTQQNSRVAYYSSSNTYVHRTVPFINNHDTFRPQLDSTGNYTGWNSGDELGPHIDPFDSRLPLAYAVAFSVDGSPQVFFEDLFNIGGSGNRWSHDPASASSLTERDALVKIIKLHQQLDFKSGAYKVRSTSAGGNAWFPAGSSASDLFVVERSAKAIIAMSDNGAASQQAWVDTDFPAGTVLVDHAGYVSGTSVVQGDQRALITAPAVSPSNGTYGFAIWGPQGALANYEPSRSSSTTQEWELSDDLGDSHASSLGQGGRIPDYSPSWRYAGKIYVDGTSSVSYTLYGESGKKLTVNFLGENGQMVHRDSGDGVYSNSFVPNTEGWLTMRVKNSRANQAGQDCFLNVTYTAPTSIDVSSNKTQNASEAVEVVEVDTDVIAYYSNGEIRVELNSDGGQYKLMDQVGRTVAAGELLSRNDAFSVSQPSGIYLLTIFEGGNTSVVKVIIP